MQLDRASPTPDQQAPWGQPRRPRSAAAGSGTGNGNGYHHRHQHKDGYEPSGDSITGGMRGGGGDGGGFPRYSRPLGEAGYLVGIGGGGGGGGGRHAWSPPRTKPPPSIPTTTTTTRSPPRRRPTPPNYGGGGVGGGEGNRAAPRRPRSSPSLQSPADEHEFSFENQPVAGGAGEWTVSAGKAIRLGLPTMWEAQSGGGGAPGLGSARVGGATRVLDAMCVGLGGGGADPSSGGGGGRPTPPPGAPPGGGGDGEGDGGVVTYRGFRRRGIL